ncbi:MAG: protein kinase [Sandaracinaceae bacterium]
MLHPGRRLALGRYIVTELLGSGGMAEVYAAEHSVLRKPVAIKLLRHEYAELPEFRERFLREGLAASRIRHPHIVDVTDACSDEELVFLVMELLEGHTLGYAIGNAGYLPLQRAVDLMLPVISALGAAHRHGIIHRDLKPENIFLAKDGRGQTVPKVLDFGVSKLAKADDRRLTAASAVLGTPHYMSPEQARGELEVDGASDQYSLAIVLFEAVTGQLPYEADTALKLIHLVSTETVPLPSSVDPALADLDGVIERATRREAGERYPSMEAFGAALLPFASPRARAEWTPAFTSGGRYSSRPPGAMPPPDSHVRRVSESKPTMPRVTPTRELVGAPASVAASIAEGALRPTPAPRIALDASVRAQVAAESTEPPPAAAQRRSPLLLAILVLVLAIGAGGAFVAYRWGGLGSSDERLASPAVEPPIATTSLAPSAPEPIAPPSVEPAIAPPVEPGTAAEPSVVPSAELAEDVEPTEPRPHRPAAARPPRTRPPAATPPTPPTHRDDDDELRTTR